MIISICARGGSKRVPGKALREINGKSLLQYAIECAKDFGRVVVSTDSKEVADAARKLGAEVPFIRPDHLATDSAAKWDVFRHLVDRIPCDILVDLDVGCPLREPQDVRGCLDLLPDFDVVCTAYEAERNPYFNMVERRKDGVHIVCDGDIIANGQEASKVYSLSPAVYAIKTSALFEYEHWSQCELGIYVIPRERAWDIDSELDLAIAEFLMKGKS